MSLFRRAAAPQTRMWTAEPLIAPFPGATGFPGGGSSSVTSALRVSAVWACVRLLADTVSMMPLGAFTMRGEVREPQPLPPLFVKPSDDATTPEWVYMLLVSLLLRGNAYGRIVSTDTYGYPTQVELLSPDGVKVRLDGSGVPVYVINGTEVGRQRIMHLRAYRMPGSALGLSPIQYAQAALQTDRAAQAFGHGFFVDGAHPSAILTTDQDVNQDGARVIKDRFRAAVQGREPAVLSGGLTYQAVQVAPNESQFLETRKATVPEIARMFGVPPEMIAGEAGNSMTYANVEQRSLDFLTYSVQPWLTRLESAFSEMLPGKRHVRFDTSVLLRTDMETKFKATAIGIASHQLLPDEARAMFDRAPFTDAEKAATALVPMTVTPSGLPKDTPGAAPAGEPAPAPQEVVPA